jgi:multidrug efflux pump subunit AcrA (membrane-fusion protein)
VLLASSGATARSAVEAALAAAQAQVDQSGERVHQPFIHLARAELEAVLGDTAARQGELREAHRLFTEIGAPIRAEQVARELAV